MIPATAAPPHSLNTLDRIAFYKSVREKRKQLQLNQHANGKDNVGSSTENAFLTQMLQSSSTSSASSASLSLPSHLRKGDYSPSSASHRTASSTLTNILPALLNGTLQSPRAISPSGTVTSPTSTNTTDTLVDIKHSTSLPVSPAFNIQHNILADASHRHAAGPTSCSPPRCRSYPASVLNKAASPPAPTSATVPSTVTSTCHLLAAATSCPSLSTSYFTSSTSPPLDDAAPKIVRSASVKSCASDSGVSSSSPLSDNNIVHVFRTNQIDTSATSQISTGSRKRKSLAHFYDELNKDKKFSSEATVSSGFNMPTLALSAGAPANTNGHASISNSSNNNIPYSQQEAIAIGYAQYALMHTLTQQFRVNYPAALLHAAAASGYLPLPPPMMAAATANLNVNGSKPASTEKPRERRKPQTPESDSNNNHIQSAVPLHEQPYRRETYQTLLESSRLLGQQKLPKPVPIDLRKYNGEHRAADKSPVPSKPRYASSSSSTSPSSSPPAFSLLKSNGSEPANDYVCIPKKLMPVIGARINDWLERNVNFALSLPVVHETIESDREKLALLSRVWHRLLIISMIENSFEIYVTKDLQVTQDASVGMAASPSSSSSSTPAAIHPTENDVKQIESLITRGKTLEIDEAGFNLIREVIVCKEGKTLFENTGADSFEKAECQAQARLTSWCSSRVKYSKVVFFLCNIYQVKEDIFERLFCAGSMHQSVPIHMHLQRLVASASTPTAMDDA